MSAEPGTGNFAGGSLEARFSGSVNLRFTIYDLLALTA
jgi:hypothetical protein